MKEFIMRIHWVLTTEIGTTGLSRRLWLSSCCYTIGEQLRSKCFFCDSRSFQLEQRSGARKHLWI